MSRRNRTRVTLTLAVGLMAALALPAVMLTSGAAPGSGSASPGVSARLGGVRSDARASAVAGLLDAPAGQRAVDEGLSIAEGLRRRYAIDTGNLPADNLAAARRAAREVLEPLRVTPEQVEQAARSLGYSLEPAACANYCENVYRLALLELHKQALRRTAGPPAL